jgi:hypothetical protein
MGNNYNYNNMDCIIESAGGIGGLWIGNYVAASDTEILLSTNEKNMQEMAFEQWLRLHLKLS